jgi:hypothetical protein
MTGTGHNRVVAASPNSNQSPTVTYALSMTQNGMLFLAERL